MNDNVPPRPKARCRPGFTPPRATFAKADPRPGAYPIVEDSWGADIPVTKPELNVIETFLGDLLDEFLSAPHAA